MSAPINQVWGPVVEGRARRRRRLLHALLVIPPLLALTVVGAALWASAQLPRADVSALAEPSQPLHILVVGSDSREQLTDEERRELSTGRADGERADTIFILSSQAGQVATLAFPRDMWVTRCDGTTGRINATIAIGGPDCLVETVHAVSGIDIHHYLEVTFGGFRDVVDAVGGVELCLDAPIADRDAGIDLPAGCQRLDGRDALGYVRVRKIDDDLQRIERQKEFIQALAREVVRPTTIANPVRAFRLARDAGAAVTVDEQMGPVSLARLGWAVRGLARGAVASHTVPVTPRITSAGAYVLDPVLAEAEPLFADFRSGAMLHASDDEPPSDATLDPADIDVAVLNGSGINGLAGRTRDRLELAGLTVVSIDNAELRRQTLVLHPPGQHAQAQHVANELGFDASLDETTAVTVITVVLGQDRQEG